MTTEAAVCKHHYILEPPAPVMWGECKFCGDRKLHKPFESLDEGLKTRGNDAELPGEIVKIY